jgi:predicted nucleic acid-binding protein
MTALVFVDTNVFVYARDGRDAVKRRRAREWLELLWKDLRGRTSTQVLNEYYSLLTLRAKFQISREAAWEDVRELLKWRPQEIDAETLTRAREVEINYRLNWWDCLIVAAAQVQGCSLLLTEDLQDKANYGGISVRNPFTLGVEEEHSAYPALPKINSRHRGRGRPRRNPPRAFAST